jgi:hypothetical protein
MVEKRVGKQSMNKGLVFLLIFLVAVGIFVFYTKMTFTGFVTNIPGGSVSSYNLSDGTFNSTKIDNSTIPYAVVLDVSNNYTNGTYISPFVGVPSNLAVVWNNFAPNDSQIPNSTITYFARVCPDTNCSGIAFSPISSGGINLIGKYIQYELYMQAAIVTNYNNQTNTTSISITSPKFYGVDMTYLIPIALSISIDTPQNTTYSNESVLITISTTNASSVWFSSDGGNNIAYTGAINETFSQAGHSITAYANDTNGHVISKTVSFGVLFPEPYCGDGVCSGAEVCANCPKDCGVCADNTGLTDNSNVSVNTCTPDWQCDSWSECINGTQTRACTDVNACGSTEGIPTGTQACVVQNPSTTSQTTTKKGFFGTVGSAILAPVTFVFGNGTRIFIFITVLVLAVVGFFAYRYFVEGKKLPFNFNLKKFGFGKLHGFDNMLE